MIHKTKFYAPPTMWAIPIKIEKGFAESQDEDMNYEDGGNAR